MEGSSSGQDDYSRLSLDDRLSHKLWKARMSAYDEIAKLLCNPSQDVLGEHFDTVKRAPLTETNAAAQEAAFAMLLQYTQSCSWELTMKLRPHLLGQIVEKGLMAGKPGTRNKTISILTAFVSCDLSSELVVSELVKIATQSMKQPKLVSAIVQSLRELLQSFGATVILGDDKQQLLLPTFLSSCFLHADKAVRQEAFDFVVLASQWSPNYPSLLSGLKPLQAKELKDAVLSAQSQEKPRATAFLRGRQPTMIVGGDRDDDGDVEMNPTIDCPTFANNDPLVEYTMELDVGPPVNVLENLPPNFNDLIESSKWKDRKDILDALLPVAKAPRIEDGRYGELISALVKRVADVNILVAISAANCLEGLAKGLRGHFGPHRSEVIIALLDRCKEKKSNVVQAMRDALHGCIYCIQSISDIITELQSATASKNPQIKQEAFGFASVVLQKAPKQCLKKDLKDLTDMIAGGLESADPQVRDSSYGAMASLFVSVGEKVVMPFLERIDKSKIAKVKEFMSTSHPAKGAGVDKPKPTNPSTIVPAKRSNERSGEKLSRPPHPPKEALCGTVDATREVMEDSFEVNVQGISENQAIDHAVQAFGSEVVTKLSSSVWKERLEAMEAVAVARPTSCFPSSELMVKFLSKTPGWRESNFQVFAKVLQALQNGGQLSREAVVLIIDGVVDKLSDPKLQRDTNNLLLKCASNTSIGFVIHHLITKLQSPSQKNPKVLVDGCKFICTALLEFGTVSIKVPFLIDALKTFLQHPNPSVRSSSVQVAATLYSFLGPNIRLLFNDQSPAILSILDTEFAKASHQSKAPILQEERNVTDNQPLLASSNVQQIEDLVPRPDVTSFVQSIISKLSDTNWKIRKEGLDEMGGLLGKTAGRMSIDAGCLLDFISALKCRFSDTNKNLSIQALELSGLLLQALVSKTFSDRVIPSCRSLVQSAMQCLADIKLQVRQAALKCLDDLASVFSASLFIGVACGCIGSCESPNLKKELLTWLARPLSMTILSPTDEDTTSIFTSILSCLQDRSGDVRKAAHSLIPSITPSDLFLKHVQKNNPSLLSTIQPLLNANATIVTTNRPKTPVKLSNSVCKKTPNKGDIVIEFFLDSNVNAATPINARLIAKWPFDGQSAPRKDQIDSLEQQSKELFSPQAVAFLFSSDFREQIAGMSLLEKSFEDAPERSLIKLQSSIDVVLRYLTIRLFDSNTAVLLKCLDVLEVCLKAMDNGGNRMNESDAAAFLPFFIHRLGEWREGNGGGGGGGGLGQRQQRVKAILRLLCRVYPASKLFNHLSEWGLRAKSNKTRSGCLEEMGTLLTRNGCSVITPFKHVPLIAGCVGDRDATVRNAALNVLVQLHRLLGPEVIYKQLVDGVMTQKDIDMFEERLKRVDLPEEEERDDGHDPIDTAQNVVQPPPTPLLQDINPFEATTNSNDHQPHELYPQSVNNLTPTIPIIRPIKTNHNNSQYSTTTLSLNHHPLDNEVDLIGCSSDAQCILALQRLDEHLNGKPSDELIERADSLIMALSIRLRAICLEDTSRHGQYDSEHEHVRLRSRLCRYVCNALVLLSSNLEVTVRIGEETLETLIANTLHALLSNTINNVFAEDKEQLLKALNVLLVKSLEGCHPNHCYRALLRLLVSAFRSPNSKDDKYPELVMKCLWKATKGLADSIDHKVISIEELLRDVDRFLRNIPPIEWKTRCAKKMPYEDLPLRTVKTIIHELVQKLGLLIQEQWTLLDDDSFGLLELHELQTQYGEDAGDQIKAFIASLGPFFQKYIERGLARIDSEIKSSKPDNSGGGEELTVQEYKERLASLRNQMFGTDIDNNLDAIRDQGSPVRNRLESPAAKFARFTAGSAPGSPLSAKKGSNNGIVVDTEATITSLRERLARLKNNEVTQ